MKKFSTKFKISSILMLLFSLNIGFSQTDFNPTISNQNSNAVNYSAYGSSNGVDTYKTLRFTIPFFQNTFTTQINFAHYGGNYNCNNTKKLYAINYTTGIINESFSNIISVQINNLSCPTNTTYMWMDLKYMCLTDLYPGNNYEVKRIQKFRIEIIKEATPNLNLTFSKYCATNPHTGLFNGYMSVQASGSYTNASYLFLRTTNNANTCLVGNEYSVVNLGNPSSPNNTVSNTTFYTCNSSTTYTVRLFYKRLNLSGVLVEYEIPSGSYGWNNYSYTKTIKNCLNPIVVYPQKNRLLLSPNPVKDNLSLQLEENEKIISLKIYDYSGVLIKSQISNSNTEVLNLQDLRKGFYFIEVQTENGIVKDKIIKE